MALVNLRVQTPGLVPFAPVVLHTFLFSDHVLQPNVLVSVQQQADLGQQALAWGVLLTVYSIAAWDYRIRITVVA
jgi:hypothetical protein